MTSTIVTDEIRPAQAVGDADARGLFDIDAGTFAAKFDQAPFLIGHELSSHPLLEFSRIMELLRSLPEQNVEYNAGTMPIGCDPEATPRTGLSAEETMRRIDECKSWLVLKNVEHDPEYRGLLEACMAEIARYSEPISPGMRHLECFIFVTSPGSITPYHMDPEHNFLLQIRGEKSMTLFDRSLATQEQLESFYSGAHRNMPFDDSFLARSVAFDLRPGMGLHVPAAMPHYVRNGDAVSISFSITFRTPDLAMRGDAHALNARLRRAGLAPGPVGKSVMKDKLKALTLRGIQRVGRMMGHDEARRGY